MKDVCLCVSGCVCVFVKYICFKLFWDQGKRLRERKERHTVSYQMIKWKMCRHFVDCWGKRPIKLWCNAFVSLRICIWYVLKDIFTDEFL